MIFNRPPPPKAAAQAARLAVAALVCCLTAAGSADAAGKLDGFWELKESGRHAAAPPNLTPWAKEKMRTFKARGDVDLELEHYCVFAGLPYVMSHAGPIDIIQDDHEFAILAEKRAAPRHIYLDAKQPDPDTFDPTPVGHSIGRWVGDALLVETTMLRDGAVGVEGTPITGGARLVERFEVTEAGKKLKVTSTWTDPKVFASPYVHTWTYDRLPDGYTAVEVYCDPRKNGVVVDVAEPEAAQ